MVQFSKEIESAIAYKGAGISAVKLNELVSRGYYTAPSTTQGASRFWAVFETLALHGLARLIDAGFPARIAARYASRFRDVLKKEGAGIVAVQLNAAGDARVIRSLADYLGGSKDGLWITFNILDIVNDIQARNADIDPQAIAAALTRKKGKR